jgi:hypothetical protein
VNQRSTNSNESDRLQRIVDRGHLRYVLLHGVLGWGLPMALVVTLIEYWPGREELFDALPLALLVFGVGGVLFGEMMWWSIRIRCDRIARRPPA